MQPLTNKQLDEYLANRHIIKGTWLWLKRSNIKTLHRVKIISIKRWKAEPARLVIRFKHGMYTHGVIDNLGELHSCWLSDFEQHSLKN